MDQQLQANILIDRAEVILCNLLALTDPDKELFKVPVIDIVVSLETAVSQLREAQSVIAGLTLNDWKPMVSHSHLARMSDINYSVALIHPGKN